MILVIYQNESDPIVAAMMKNSYRLPEKVVFLDAKQFVDQVEIYDFIEEGVPSLQWTLADGTVIKNDESVLVVNRLQHLDSKLFDDFHAEDREYAQQEFWAYLSFALSAFPRCTAHSNFLGLSGPTAPLPMQWQEVKQQFKDAVAVPDYYMGQRQYYEPIAPSQDMVVSDPYNFFHWKRSSDMNVSKGDPDQFIFTFKRPNGVPLTVFICADQTLIRTFGGIQLTDSLKRRIASLTDSLQTVFKLKLGEYLFFLENENLSFGACYASASESTAADSNFSNTLMCGIGRL